MIMESTTPLPPRLRRMMARLPPEHLFMTSGWIGRYPPKMRRTENYAVASILMSYHPPCLWRMLPGLPRPSALHPNSSVSPALTDSRMVDLLLHIVKISGERSPSDEDVDMDEVDTMLF